MYKAKIEPSLNGDYRFVDNPNHPPRLRYHVKTCNDGFKSTIQHKAIKYPWQVNDQDNEVDGIGVLNWINNT
jgi:hypothetical protein